MTTYAWDEHTGDGEIVSWDVTFPFIHTSHVKATVAGVATAVSVSEDGTVTFETAPAEGVEVVLYRQTPLTPLASMVSGTLNDAETNRLLNQQTLYAIQEARDYDEVNALALADLDLPQLIAQALAFGGVWTFEGPPGPTGPSGAAIGACPVGSVLAYGGTVAPTGWLLCYGQAISRTTYANLFAVFSTTFGEGNGSTTFNLPDLRGRVVIGKDNMGGSSANRITEGASGMNGDTLGEAGGEQSITLETSQLPAHTHGITATRVAVNGGLGGTGSGDVLQDLGALTATGSAGSGADHPNVQPSIVFNVIVKT